MPAGYDISIYTALSRTGCILRARCGSFVLATTSHSTDGFRPGMVYAPIAEHSLRFRLEVETQDTCSRSSTRSSRHPDFGQRVRYSSRSTVGDFQQPLEKVWCVVLIFVSKDTRRGFGSCTPFRRRRDLFLDTRPNDNRSQLRVRNIRLVREAFCDLFDAAWTDGRHISGVCPHKLSFFSHLNYRIVFLFRTGWYWSFPTMPYSTEWRLHRRLLSPFFQSSAVGQWHAVHTREAHRMLEGLLEGDADVNHIAKLWVQLTLHERM